jgi:hypothetical protein
MRKRYYPPSSELIGWAAYFYNNGSMQKYSSDTHLWSEIPNTGVLFVARYYKDSNNKITAIQINAQDIYCLTDEQEQLAALTPGIKLGEYVEDSEYLSMYEQFLKDFSADITTIKRLYE